MDIEQGEFIPEVEYLLTLEIKDTNLCSFDRFENSFIRFILLILFKTIKMHEIFTEKVEKSGKKLSSSKHKFSKGLAHIQELRKFVPEIDEFNRHDMESTLNDLHDILSHFYASDEFPFTAI